MARRSGITIEKICNYLDLKYHMLKVHNKRPGDPGTERILFEEYQEFMLPPSIPIKAKRPFRVLPDDEIGLHF